MKKVLLFAAGALCIATAASAQITLNQSSFTDLHLGADSVLVIDSGAALNSINLTPAANAMWDLSTLSGSTNVGYRLSSNIDGAQYADSNVLFFGSFAYTSNSQQGVTGTGIMSYGETIPRAGYSISSQTGGSTDSVIIDDQNIVFSSPTTLVAFPATYGSHWLSSFHYDFNFELSIALFGYNHAPGIVRAYVTRNDSVSGYGQMRVRDMSGNPSGYMDVLQIQSTETIIDSFFINGSQANSVILNAFQFTQGQVSKSYTQYYYRPAELTPLTEVDYNDSTYSQPDGAQTHEQRLSHAEAVVNVKAVNGLKVYPNPVVNNTVTVEMAGAQNTSYDYQLINMNGQIVNTNTISFNGNSAQLNFANTAAGIYYLRVMSNGKQTAIYPLTIAK